MWVFLVMGTQKNREGTRISCQVCWSTTAVATAESHTDCPRGVSSFFGYSNVLASLFVSSTFWFEVYESFVMFAPNLVLKHCFFLFEQAHLAIAGNAMDELEADTTIEPLLGPDEGPKRPAVLFDNLKVLESMVKNWWWWILIHLTSRICFGKLTLTMGNPLKTTKN